MIFRGTFFIDHDRFVATKQETELLSGVLHSILLYGDKVWKRTEKVQQVRYRSTCRYTKVKESTEWHRSKHHSYNRYGYRLQCGWIQWSSWFWTGSAILWRSSVIYLQQQNVCCIKESFMSNSITRYIELKIG